MMVAGAWLCLLAPLAGALAITLAGARISRRTRRLDLDALGLRRLRRRGRLVPRHPGQGRRRPRGALDRLHVARRGRLPRRLADPRRPALPDDDARRHRRRRPDRLVLDGLHGRRGRGAPLLRLHGAVRLLDADARAGRQPAAPARRLGPRRPRLLPPDRLLPRAPRGDRGRQEGVRDERDRRRGDGARPLPADRQDRLARLLHHLRRGLERRALLQHREPRRARPARRRRRQVGAAAAAHVAAGRDGGPDPGLRPDPRGHDGDRRRLPDRAARTRSSRRRRTCSTWPRSSAP